MAGAGLCTGAFLVASQVALLDEMHWGKSWLALGGMQGLVLGGTPGLALGGTLGLALGGTLGLALGGTLGLALGGTLGLTLGGMLEAALGGAYLARGELPFEHIMHAALTDSLSHTIVHQSSSQSSRPQDLAARQNT